MKHLLHFSAIALLLFGCQIDDDVQSVYSASNLHRIPFGQTGTLASGNYTGQGSVTNVSGTTVNLQQGITTLDAFSIGGRVNVPVGATLIVNDVVNVGGGARLDIDGFLSAKTLTQVGDISLSSGKIDVNGRYTIGGGTTLYIANSQIEVSELVITGNIQCIDNAFTRVANWYSLIELTDNKVLNRGGGTTVCGPLLFNSDDDTGSTDATLTDVTNQAVANNGNVKAIYGLADTAKLFQYNDACTPMGSMPQ